MRDQKPVRASVFGSLQPRGATLNTKSVLSGKVGHEIIEEQQSGQDLSN